MDIGLIHTLELPTPRTRGGAPLLEALQRRHSTRSYAARSLTDQLQSDLLWAACGVNRAASGGRTAPSTRNWREIDVYVLRSDGAFVFEPAAHRLRPVVGGDLRAQSGAQDFVGVAPINLVYVADLSRVEATDALERRFYCAADAAFIAQNVYLFCASEGLACVVRGLVDRCALARALQLGPRQRVILAQTVGYPA